MILDLTSANIIFLQKNILMNKWELQKNSKVRATFTMLIYYMELLERHFDAHDNDDYQRQYLVKTINSLLQDIEDKVELKFTDLELEKLDFESRENNGPNSNSLCSYLATSQLTTNLRNETSASSLLSLTNLSSSSFTLTSLAQHSPAGLTLTAYLNSVSQTNKNKSLTELRKKSLSLRELAANELKKPLDIIEAAKNEANALAVQICELEEYTRMVEEDKRLNKLTLEY